MIDGAHRALVTSGAWEADEDARISAIWAANVLDGTSRISNAEWLVNTALDESLWHHDSLRLDGRPVAVMRGDFFDVSVAYIREGAALSVAWRGEIELARIERRSVDAYPLDPWMPHSNAELNAQQIITRNTAEH
ncbi:hypothetical protein [Microbacterium gorillae]|uniref:hypothetical protein n=1 Tax=Microbacterium gorillae TaxID=1231063 RepID=UPI0011423080|nr:hypothetical protein [Microbacterium gorillae]